MPNVAIPKSMSRLLADECCRKSLIDELRANGFDVVAIAEISPSISDVKVAELALAQNRILITDDKDFGDIVVRRNLHVPGVILLRTSSDDGGLQARRIFAILSVAPDRILGHITIVEDTRYRHRPI